MFSFGYVLILRIMAVALALTWSAMARETVEDAGEAAELLCI